MNKVFSFAIGDLFSRGDGTLELYQYLMLFGGAFVLVAGLLLIVYFILFARHKRYLAANDRVETDTLKIPNTKRMTSTDYNEMLRELNAIHEDAALREFVRNPIEAELVIAEDRIKYMQGLGYRNYNDASINEMNELIKRLRAENFAEVKVSLFKKADGTVEETILEDAETARRSALIRDAIDYENARRDVAIRQLQLELEILTAERAMQAAQECIDRCARELGENSMVAVLTPAERYDLLREQAHYIRDLKESSDTVERLRAESRKLGERETSAVFTLNDTVHDSERLKAESEARRLDAEQRAGEADGRRIALERRLAELEEKMRYSADAGSRESDIESVRIISAYERERLF
ncbi:MAG: hypothetical protein LBS99_02540, partial [Clostridiales bacterium]|nr:hypothetical protein [Clostridiales bacterium]